MKPSSSRVFVAVTPRLFAEALSDALRRRGVRTTDCERDCGLLVVDEADRRAHRSGTLRLELPADGVGRARIVTDHGVAAALVDEFEGVLSLVAALSRRGGDGPVVPRESGGDDGSTAGA